MLPGLPGLAAITGLQQAVEQSSDVADLLVDEVHRHQRLGAAVTDQDLLALKVA
ncbi:hypothetical protein D3C78_1744040 [compost metagenome]